MFTFDPWHPGEGEEFFRCWVKGGLWQRQNPAEKLHGEGLVQCGFAHFFNAVRGYEMVQSLVFLLHFIS